MMLVNGMEKVTKYARFNYCEQDYDLINDLDEYINAHVGEVYDFFDIELPRDLVKINIIPTKKQYDELVQNRKQKLEVPLWEIGNYNNGIIEYVSLHDYKNTTHAFPPEKYDENLEYYKKTIIHEYVHYVIGLYLTNTKSDNPLKYLNEGLAQYLSHQRDKVKPIFTYSLDEIIKSNNCYLGWYLITKFIIEEKGKDYFLKLLKNSDYALSLTPKIYKEAKEFYNN